MQNQVLLSKPFYQAPYTPTLIDAAADLRADLLRADLSTSTFVSNSLIAHPLSATVWQLCIYYLTLSLNFEFVAHSMYRFNQLRAKGFVDFIAQVLYMNINGVCP